ncbi:MAG: hypothetical protein ACO23R_19525 [bacterium]
MFDTQKVLNAWNFQAENQKVQFLDHCYECYGRNDPGHPMHGLYTGLWQEFCIKEAGEVVRNQYFEFLAAVKEFESTRKQNEPNQNSNI